MPEGLLIVISAPSGGGKGTILKELFAQDANQRVSRGREKKMENSIILSVTKSFRI